MYIKNMDGGVTTHQPTNQPKAQEGIMQNTLNALADYQVKQYDQSSYPNIYEAVKMIGDGKIAVMLHCANPDEWTIFETTTNDLTKDGDFDWDGKAAQGLGYAFGNTWPHEVYETEAEALAAFAAI